MALSLILLAFLFALYLSAADIASTEIGQRFGRGKGFALWLLAVAAPIVAALLTAPKIALTAMGISTVLSYIAYRIRMRSANKHALPATSPPYCDHD